jgi:hypothetical protein
MKARKIGGGVFLHTDVACKSLSAPQKAENE